MDANLLGYLLNSLEPNEARQVEAYLQGNPAAQQKLQRLQHAIDPLSADLESGPPPAGLWIRTLARVAEYQCQRLPVVPSTVAFRSSSGRSWWRRADVLVAASVLLCLMLVVPPGINYVRHQYQVAACKENLHKFHVALASYSDDHHGQFPDVATASFEPRNVAGMFVPVLREAGLLGDQVSVRCPANPQLVEAKQSRHQLEQLSDDEFDAIKPHLAGNYSYPLGYLHEGKTRGPRMETNGTNQVIPLMADRPPEGIDEGITGNSRNHNGRGQVVLFQDGHAAFVNSRHVGYEGDDIYLNRDAKVRAGRDRTDAVLGHSAARP